MSEALALVDDRRELSVLDPGDGMLSAALYLRDSQFPHRELVIAVGDRERCRMTRDTHGDVTLWIRGAAFPVSEAEAQQIQERFGLSMEARP